MLFRHRLALALGRTVAELGAMDCGELTDWAAYHRVEPWGERRGDYRAAQICHTLYHMLRGKDAPGRELSDFLLEFGGEKKARTPEEIALAWQVFTIQAGGTIESGGSNG